MAPVAWSSRARPAADAHDRVGVGGRSRRPPGAGAFAEGTMREGAADRAFRTLARARHRIPEESAEDRAAPVRDITRAA